ncbi:PQQ-dependent sugar dehydrogenase [Georgenia sp. SUBG003]|uniref:PQQ-dependent sugar dehydrogenase n=1 Tax=Georgenia sp. SUBG003 TaxID=1497974 RepID=UPI003AB37619
MTGLLAGAAYPGSRPFPFWRTFYDFAPLRRARDGAPEALRATAVLLDLDGTITDSAPAITSAIAETLAAFGYPPETPEQLLRHVGPPHPRRPARVRRRARGGPRAHGPALPRALRPAHARRRALPPACPSSDEDYGLLYMLVDGGNGVGNSNPQDLATPHGKIFRIDPLGDDSENGQYGVPGTNPFVDTPGALGEIYAVGMRDPHRISWDPQGDNRMFLGHIGEWQVESIYEVRAGDNFGWSEREGPFLAENRQIYPLPANDDEFGFTYPVAAYDHNRDPARGARRCRRRRAVTRASRSAATTSTGSAADSSMVSR